MFGLGLPELIVIFLVILVLFGAKNIPEIAKGLGNGLKVFKKELKDSAEEDTTSTKEIKKDQSKDETS